MEEFYPNKNQNLTHVGLIPDGVRRWSAINGVSLLDSYLTAMKKITAFLNFFYESGVTTVSVYLSSSQNFKRTEWEIEAICRSETIFCTDDLPELVKVHKTQVKGIGMLHKLPTYLSEGLKKIEEATQEHEKTKLYLCLAYNPFYELEQALKACEKPNEITQCLLVKEPIDFVIRSSGANILSNFLLLQCGYARLYFLDELFNDLEIEQMKKIFDEFSRLNRKFGE